MAEKTIFVFPGQGAQYVGMAKDILQDFAVARHTFEQVSDFAHRDIKRICFDGPQCELNMPENASLATFAHSVAIAHILSHEFKMPVHALADAICGHSMGQYAALYCADSLNFADAVSVLSARSTYMTRASGDGGGMAAIVGLDCDVVQHLLAQSVAYGYAEIANYNAIDQFVISGQNTALNAVMDLARQAGARVVRRLNVSVPAHCALMARAAQMLRVKLDKITISAPKSQWFSNETATIVSNPADIRNCLIQQMTHGVRWVQIMDKFPQHQITHAYELGPGRVLTRLIMRANVGTNAVASDHTAGVRDVIEKLSQRVR